MTTWDCGVCGGSGVAPGETDVECEYCDGTGRRHREAFETPSGGVLVVNGSGEMTDELRRTWAGIAERAR